MDITRNQRESRVLFQVPRHAAISRSELQNTNRASPDIELCDEIREFCSRTPTVIKIIIHGRSGLPKSRMFHHECIYKIIGMARSFHAMSLRGFVVISKHLLGE